MTDGKGHLVAFDPNRKLSGPPVLRRRKDISPAALVGWRLVERHLQRHPLDPRIDWKTHGTASFDWKEGKYSASCPPKTTEMTEVSGEEAKKILDGAALYRPKWQRLPQKLARDDKGNYYFVDCARDDTSRAGGRLRA